MTNDQNPRALTIWLADVLRRNIVSLRSEIPEVAASAAGLLLEARRLARENRMLECSEKLSLCARLLEPIIERQRQCVSDVVSSTSLADLHAKASFEAEASVVKT